MRVQYAKSDEAWEGVVSFIQSKITESGAKRILEVGAGANPTFSTGFVKENDLSYTLLDLSQEELAKAPDGYKTIHADISQPNLNILEEYDFVFSRMLAEHVSNGKEFHKNIFNYLAVGGTAFHFFPTLYAFPFVINALLPERLSRWLLNIVQSGRHQHGKHAKFPAYYSWCRGPTEKQIKRLESIGFNVIQYIGFFGHSGYYKKMPIIERIHSKISDVLVSYPVPLFTSFSYVVLGKERQ